MDIRSPGSKIVKIIYMIGKGLNKNDLTTDHSDGTDGGMGFLTRIIANGAPPAWLGRSESHERRPWNLGLLRQSASGDGAFRTTTSNLGHRQMP